MKRAIVGSQGFVGSTLARQLPNYKRIHRGNFGDIISEPFDEVIFTAVPAKKWLANSDPESDLSNLESILRILERSQIRHMTLISTVDVFDNPIAVDEDCTPDSSPPNYYGSHRLYFEQRCREIFEDCLVVRLPGLVGRDLRKNAIYDLKFGNDVDKLNGASVFQFYPMRNIASDIAMAKAAETNTIHLTAQPIELSVVAEKVFGMTLNKYPDTAVHYDFRSRFAGFWGSATDYQYSSSESLEAIAEFKSEVAS